MQTEIVIIFIVLIIIVSLPLEPGNILAIVAIAISAMHYYSDCRGSKAKSSFVSSLDEPTLFTDKVYPGEIDMDDLERGPSNDIGSFNDPEYATQRIDCKTGTRTTGRLDGKYAMPDCEQAYKMEIIGDEQVIHQGLRRNEPKRSKNGIRDMARRSDPYVREELEEREQSEWWGRGDDGGEGTY